MFNFNTDKIDAVNTRSLDFPAKRWSYGCHVRNKCPHSRTLMLKRTALGKVDQAAAVSGGLLGWLNIGIKFKLKAYLLPLRV